MTTLFMGGLLLLLFVLFTVQARDIQVVTQYSAFGESHFYKDRWFYLYSFAGFGLLLSTAHTAVMAKLYSLGQRDIGVLFGGVSLIILFVAAKYSYEVMHLAFL